MDGWDDIVRAAVLGTARQPAPSTAPAVVAEVLARANGASGEAKLLNAAAAMSLYRRAGRRFAPGEGNALTPADPDALPACSPVAADYLQRILAGEHPEVLPEWLAACAAAGRRVPHRCLPDLLGVGTSRVAWRDLILPVLDRRGLWLAAQRPEWGWTIAVTDEGEWASGTRESRLAVLRHLRRADPPRAVALLESTWPQETPEDRAAFIAALDAGLSEPDEPFLGRVLDDKRKEVRRAAADLLSRLPQSQFVRRMTDRMVPLLRYVPPEKGSMLKLKSARPGRIEVTLPAECDKAMVRDGIEPKPPHGVGEKAWWLMQMLASVPPKIWENGWSASPDAIVNDTTKGEWAPTLAGGWAAAAAHNRDAAWAEALLRGRPNHPLPLAEVAWAADAAQRLIAVLPPDRAEAYAIDVMTGKIEPPKASTAWSILPPIRHPWSRRLGMAVLGRLRLAVTQRDAVGLVYTFRETLQLLGLRLPPELASEVTQGWDIAEQQRGYWATAIDEFSRTLEFRRNMLKEIAT